ncbi:alpha/beta hydrolase family domain-containing protein [Purpureocillium lilacinum]|uniref:Alpha/beta hydrolase family domain-containing protein n=1 Tax=Purpureocillium lilacinum TaxID=33203 RepID=A0A179GME4_PURLI|nr:alpha/beta hydrolase family domain-containing protein [Purpureocillium lilacinum]
MSFERVTTYKRSILRPLVVSSSSVGPKTTGVDSQLRLSRSQPWQESTHIFIGTGDRDESDAWPPTKFSDDPTNIPDSDRHNIPYDIASAESRQQDFKLYSDRTQKGSNVLPPRIVVKRYIPTAKADNGEQGITLLMLTGMGAVKEMFEPMLEDLLPQLRKAGVRVQEVWTFDMPLCGETAKVNPIGYLYVNEKDITRDLLLFITAYLPLEPGQDLPDQLSPRLPTTSPDQPTRKHLHVIAHSLGAQAAILASAHAPTIFSSITVADPAMIPSGKINTAMAKLPKDIYCLNLPEQFPTRSSVEKELQVNKRTRGWDQRVSRVFAQHGVVPDDSGKGFRLAARPRLEWALYYDKQTPTECYDRLVDVAVPFHAIMPARPFAVPPAMFKTDVAKMKQKTRVRWLEGTTHQVLYEKMDAFGKFVDSCFGPMLPEVLMGENKYHQMSDQGVVPGPFATAPW